MLGEELLVFAAVCKENNLAGLIRLRDDLQYFGRTGSRAGDYDLDRFGNRSIHGSRHLWECGGGALEDRIEVQANSVYTRERLATAGSWTRARPGL